LSEDLGVDAGKAQAPKPAAAAVQAPKPVKPAATQPRLKPAEGSSE
jgi:hypothetical protein